jgi:ribosomal protein S18 acetylase RimI-like enzyme
VTVTLRPMRADEYGAWLVKSDAGYRHDMEQAGIDPELAATKSKADHEGLLPEGVDTKGHWLYTIEDDGVPVGSLWLADRDGNEGRSIFVYNISLDPEHRGRGLGRAAMQLAEEKARELGHDAISLNVFGGNDVARRLYLSLGYEETAIAMKKRL